MTSEPVLRTTMTLWTVGEKRTASSGAAAGAVLIGWGVTAIGMLMLAFVFQTLANRKPELDNGVYAYAKAGFGNYLGFSSAWGYWISAWLGNVSYLVLLFGTLVFNDGSRRRRSR